MRMAPSRHGLFRSPSTASWPQEKRQQQPVINTRGRGLMMAMGRLRESEILQTARPQPCEIMPLDRVLQQKEVFADTLRFCHRTDHTIYVIQMHFIMPLRTSNVYIAASSNSCHLPFLHSGVQYAVCCVFNAPSIKDRTISHVMRAQT